MKIKLIVIIIIGILLISGITTAVGLKTNMLLTEESQDNSIVETTHYTKSMNKRVYCGNVIVNSNLKIPIVKVNPVLWQTVKVAEKTSVDFYIEYNIDTKIRLDDYTEMGLIRFIVTVKDGDKETTETTSIIDGTKNGELVLTMEVDIGNTFAFLIDAAFVLLPLPPIIIDEGIGGGKIKKSGPGKAKITVEKPIDLTICQIKEKFRYNNLLYKKILKFSPVFGKLLNFKLANWRAFNYV